MQLQWSKVKMYLLENFSILGSTTLLRAFPFILPINEYDEAK